MVVLALAAPAGAAPAGQNANPPAQPVKLIFIHHSTGGNWLADPNEAQPYGGLGRALRDNNYYVSATNYGWGPDAIGDRTDIPNWPEWFTGPASAAIMRAVYTEADQNVGDFGAWARLAADPGGENEIIMFKSCFPNSDLAGNPDDPPLAAPTEEYSVANAKAVYNDILTYFATRQDKLFIVITAPPLQESETAPDRAANARAFNYWLVHDWLADYPHANVAVFDYHNVLTGPDNHHWWNGREIERLQATDDNYAAYPSGDSHPSTAGHQKATQEFIPLLNIWYHRWKEGAAAPAPTVPATPPAAQATATRPAAPTSTPAPPDESIPPAGPGSLVDDFEDAANYHSDANNATLNLSLDAQIKHSGGHALRVEYALAANGGGSLGRSFDQLQNWQSGAGLTLWVRADPAGGSATLMIFSGELDAPTPFEAVLEIPAGAAQDWQPITVPWEAFAKAGWAGAEGIATLDLTRITGYGLGLNASEAQRGTLWLDGMALSSGAAAPVAVAATPTVTPPPPPAPATPAPAGSGGPCPAAALALALGLAAVWQWPKRG
jgi:hypothetical protein